MRNLIIIGNGFDLAHGLKTDYESFIADIEKDVNTDQKKYGLKKLSDNSFLYLLSKEKFIDPNWSDIENFYFKLLMKIGEAEKDKINYGLNVEMLNDNFQQVKEFLAKYLHEQEVNFENRMHDSYRDFFNFFDCKDDVVVLNFNYTKTVKAYTDKYPNIELLQIHGELDGDKESEANPMIFGYAAADDESKRLLDENNSQFVRNIKKFNYLFTNNDTELKSLLRGKDRYNNSIDFNVYVLGHSCGLSDKLILNQIFNAETINEITLFYHKGRDGYFETMVNIDRIIDDYTKTDDVKKASDKILAFPDCFRIPQTEDNETFVKFFDYHKEKSRALMESARKWADG